MHGKLGRLMRQRDGCQYNITSAISEFPRRMRKNLPSKFPCGQIQWKSWELGIQKPKCIPTLSEGQRGSGSEEKGPRIRILVFPAKNLFSDIRCCDHRIVTRLTTGQRPICQLHSLISWKSWVQEGISNASKFYSLST